MAKVPVTLTVTTTALFDNGVDVDFFSGDQRVTVPRVLVGLTPVEISHDRVIAEKDY
jgi:hypothetical protein